MVNQQTKTPPPYQEDKIDLIKLLNQIILFLFLWFVGYLVKVMIKSGKEEAISIFLEIRNRVYLTLIFLFGGLGVGIIIQRIRGWQEKNLAEQALQKPLSTLAIALVYTTFAYAVAQMFFDLGKLLGLF